MRLRWHRQALEDLAGIFDFIASAVTEKISALTTEDILADRAAKACKGAFKAVLARVPKRPPLPGD